MGGKQNRTKNNVRPSNSGRSAAMLHSSLPQFTGFSGISEASGLSSFAFNLADEFDSSIDDNFQLVLKKVSKKDCTTKLKGLQELAELLQKADLGVIKTLLPTWVRFFSILVIHPDNRIREATQNVHHAIVLKAKRELAPYLKQLMAPWFTSQYDNYPPAASAASQAFKDTFSPSKFKEVVNFCHQEILNYIHDNLLNHTAQTVSSSQLSPQEAEARYERIVISCLQGYAMLLDQVSDEKNVESMSLHTQIVANKKFTKLATRKVALVRSSWFQVLSAVLQKAVYLLKNKEVQVMSIILSSLEDDEATVLPHIWECLLLATSNSEWWRQITIEQQFIPKLLNVLKHAGNGNATIIYPNLLPLLSQVPFMEEKKKNQFYVSFFENILAGLKLKQVSSSLQDSKAISVAYVECLQYLIAKNLTNEQLCKTLIKQLCSFTEWCLSKEGASYKIIFVHISNFISYLTRNSQLEFLTEYFFSCLDSIFLRTHSSADSSLVMAKQVELLLLLKNIDGNRVYLSMVHAFGVKIFKTYLNYVEETPSRDICEKLYALMDGFDTLVIFESLLDILKEEHINPQYMNIYKKWFKKWLESDEMYCKSVLDLIFLLFRELEDHSKDVILNDLIEIHQPNCLIWSVSRALSHPYVEDPIVQKWLKGDTVGKLFLSIADMYISDECTPELDHIFKSALKENTNGEFVIDKDILSNIVEMLWRSISKHPKENSSLNSVCKLAAFICKVIYTKTHSLTYGDQLLLALFDLSCKFDLGNSSLPSCTISDVNAVWKQSLLVVLQTSGESETLIEKLMEIVERNFKSNLVSRQRNRISHLNYVIRELVVTIYQSCPELVGWLVGFVFKKSRSSRDNIVDLCKIAEYIKGRLDSPWQEIDVKGSITDDEMLKYFTYNFLTVHTLGTTFTDSASKPRKNIKVFERCESPTDSLLEVVYSYAVVDTFLMHFSNVRCFNELLHCHHLSEKIINEIFENTSQESIETLKYMVNNNGLTHGWLWSKAVYLFYTKFLKSGDSFSVYNKIIQNVDQQNDSIGALHLRQIFKVRLEDVANNEEIHHYKQELGEINGRSDIRNITDEEISKMVSIFRQVEKFRNESLSDFFYENCDISWQKTNQVIKAVKQCTILMGNYTMPQKYWNFIVLSMVSWLGNCLKSKQLIYQYQYQAMLVSLAELYVVTCKKIEKLKQENFGTNFVNEWEDVLLEGIHADIAQIWIFLADHCSTKSLENPLSNLPLLQCFGKVTKFIRHDFVFKGTDNVPKWTKFLKISSCKLLTNSQTVLQIWGYKILLTLVPGLVKIDDDAVNTTTPHRNGLIFEQFKEKLIEVEDIVNSVLIDFRIGENSCKVEPSYDSFTYTFAYLLLWDVMLGLCEQASAELRYQYSDWLKNSSLLEQFITNLFKLMPVEVLRQDEATHKSLSDKFLNSHVDAQCYSDFFGSDSIENFACYLYKRSLEQFPALVRQWWTVLDIKTSQIVEKVTISYVSPHICNMELSNVVHHQNACKNLRVKVMPVAREIMAVYTVDETQMELTITLPPNYPLGSPNIVGHRQISGASQKQWLLQFKKCVLHQNGKIWDGLYLWNSSLDRKFDGVEECYICYAVLHSGTYQLPKLCCRTCKKKFHSACLYKWFSTSNKSSCPICRNLF